LTAVRREGIERLRCARVAVWGTGAEGRAVAQLAADLGAAVTVVDDHPAPMLPDAPAPPKLLVDRDFDVVVRSPGVSTYRPELAAARSRGALVTTLTALWLEDFGDSPVVAVTGSKGKSTTAVLTAAALRATGRRVALAGNIGRSLTELYGSEAPPVDAYVVEVSSYQAADVTVSPRVGVLTLVAPDHLEWHGSYDRYVADKLNLFGHRSGMTVAVNASDPVAWEASAHLPGRVGYGVLGSGVGLETPAGFEPGSDRNFGQALDRHGAAAISTGAGDVAVVTVDGAPYASGDILVQSKLSLRGVHNLVNFCGALTAARALTGEVADVGALRLALDHTAPLESRLRTVASTSSLELVDDALASNPAGAVAALKLFAGRRLCLVAGGADRGVSFEPLVAQLARMRPAPAVIALGPAGARLATEIAAANGSALTPGSPSDAGRAGPVVVEAAAGIPEAVQRAVTLLEGSGVVLFSPAAPTPAHEGTYLDRSALFAAAAVTAVDALRSHPCHSSHPDPALGSHGARPC